MNSIDGDALTLVKCRMARAALSVSIDRAAELSKVSQASITRFEHGGDIRPVLRAALRGFFEQSGVVFTPRGVEVQLDHSQSGMAA